LINFLQILKGESGGEKATEISAFEQLLGFPVFFSMSLSLSKKIFKTLGRKSQH
jgi:hypothetical protein